ncbi:MAG: uroporphyrinogen decarboxylase [Bacteroidetes bacterium]|nr:uroporphyrinogen decarboxylase [Bacteroidota bacterium]
MINDLFLRACKREPVERTPVWLMRQAGRYLPEYRAIRAKTDFLTLCRTPELAAEVSIQPVEIIGTDACIIFSDILVLPEAMGVKLFIEENTGPYFENPVRTRADIDKLIVPDPCRELKYVMDAIRLTRKNLNNRVPLIGFAGSPWTLATYLAEGKGSRNFSSIKELIYTNPKDAHALLDKLARTTAAFLSAEIEAGAQAVQIFDTWGGILPPDEFREFSLRYIEQVLKLLKHNGAPAIVFCKNCGHSLEAIADTGCSVVGIDSSIDIEKARMLIGSYTALQGNLDPALLYAGPDRIREGVKRILGKFGKGSGHIFNLGHGVLPDTPVGHVKAFVQAVKEESAKYHK